MNIALIAHDEKKELMVQFCIAYCGVLSRNNLCATGTTGKMVSEATGLTIQKFLAGSQAVSYTHLDVYKRQELCREKVFFHRMNRFHREYLPRIQTVS